MSPRERTGRAAGALVELFSGIQGEGPWIGRRQIFLRLAECNLDCAYCDQPEAREAPPFWLREKVPGARDFAATPNPVPPEQAAAAVLELDAPRGLHHAVSVTGGEPLLQSAFLKALLPPLRKAGLRVLIETNGTLAEGLRRLRGGADLVSMDIKLRSATGRPMPRKRHGAFLAEAARQGLDGYAKAVVTAETTPREVRAAARLIAASHPRWPLVLQPVTPRAGKAPPAPEALLVLQARAAELHADVRAIPQVHGLMGQR
jgi:organic radical activating enzyme